MSGASKETQRMEAQRLVLGFHALDFRDVLIREKKTLYVGGVHAVDSDGVEPAVLARLGAQAASAADRFGAPGDYVGEFFADESGVAGRVQGEKGLADQFFGEVAENA